MITIKPVKTSREKQAFINVPKTLYKNDPNWIAPLDIMVHNQLNPKKNPTFDQLDAQLWIAYNNKQPVGRISAQINQLHLKHQNATEGHFGFLEADTKETMDQLIRTAELWLHKKGMTKILGPFNLSINEEMGLLVDGFDTPPYFMMGHHNPAYQEWLTSIGFSKAKDVLGFSLYLEKPFSKQWQTLVKRAKSKDIKTRKINMKDYNREFDITFDLWNDSAKDNWGFLPIEQNVITHIKSDFKFLLDPDGCIFSTQGDQTTGIMIAVPNLNDILKDLNGKLLPWGWLKLLYRLKIKKIKTYRVIMGGIQSEIQNSHIGGQTLILILDRIAEEGRKKKVTHVDVSWVLEDNMGLLKVIDLLGVEAYKRYRIFSKAI